MYDPDMRECPACHEVFPWIDGKDMEKFADHLSDHLREQNGIDPWPGSQAAEESGCYCPDIANHGGEGFRGDPDYAVVKLDCPLHGFAPGEDGGKP